MLNSSGFFSDTVTKELTSADAVAVAKEIAAAAERSRQAACDLNFSAMRQPPDEALRKRAQAAGLNIPPEINELDQRLQAIGEIQQWLLDFAPEVGDYSATLKIEKKRAEVDLLTSAISIEAIATFHKHLADFPSAVEDDAALAKIGAERLEAESHPPSHPPSVPKTSAFEKMKIAIGLLADGKRVQVLNALLTGENEGRVQPPKSIEWFDRALARTKLSSGPNNLSLIFSSERQVIDGWKFVEAQAVNRVPAELDDQMNRQTVWPPWLQAKAQRLLDTASEKKTDCVTREDFSSQQRISESAY